MFCLVNIFLKSYIWVIKIMIIKIFYSIALIIFSISMLSSYLEKTFVSNKLYVLSNNHYSMFILGIAITAITQSSTAITALTLSFLNSKKISFKAAVAIVLGSNIGTSFTSIITGIQYINYYIIFIIGFIIYMLYWCIKCIDFSIRRKILWNNAI